MQTTTLSNLEHIRILGVKVHLVTTEQLHRLISNLVSTDKKALVLNVNVHCLNLSYAQPWLRDFLNGAEVVFCDGAGVMLAGSILGHHIPERITYADWMWRLAEYAEDEGLSFYFLGAKPGVAEQAAARLRQRYPRLEITGIHHGYFDKTSGSPENEEVIQMISAAKPSILIIGFGMPVQENWLMENWGRIDANVVLTGGAVFDYISGTTKRGPRWMTDHGLEWLARLVIEPMRLWKRYLIGNPVFLWRIILERLGLLSFEEETTKR